MRTSVHRLGRALAFAALSAALAIGPAWAQARDKDLDLIRDLMEQERQLEKDRQELINSEKLLSTRELVLKREAAEIKQEQQQNRSEFERWKAEGSVHQAQSSQFNARCANRPLSRAEYQSCLPEKTRLDQWEQRLIGWHSTLMRRYNDLNRRQQNLSQKTLEWARQKKEVNAKSRDWEERRSRWLAGVRRAVFSPNLEDLKRRADASSVCASLQDLEAAHRCLQRIWDGAR